jgi:hypothetical protein
MTKREFILRWAKEETHLTSYNMHPKVIEWQHTFYSDDRDERKAICNLTYHFRNLVKERVLYEPKSMGLGQFSKTDFFGTTKQFFWEINKEVLTHKLSNIN